MILVCGGAGYIGSHMVALLNELGKKTVVVDNLSTGHKEAVAENKLYVGDLRDEHFLDEVFSQNQIEAVIDFAAFSLVGESMTNPLKYFDNNISSTISLLKAMQKHGTNKIVFSSTAAVYGNAQIMPIDENQPTAPTSTYGESKLIVENILNWCDNCLGIKYASLRYFNAAGAHKSGKIGEMHHPETHLIPIIAQTILGQRDKLDIYGDDYPTPDGTCIRDYIHVMDLVAAHDLALQMLNTKKQSAIYNLGNGVGFSVKEVVKTFEQVTGKKVKTQIAPKRPGDPAQLIASDKKAQTELNWHRQFNDKAGLEKIIESAYKWHSTKPQGYNTK
ncbi:MAG: UDP-glucose 4-epimerase GalE [Defluviitaleaceae bacterium]|nr:UDP-glucose 4-epimerase GalE [Defluviitaleaceae bacterium]